MSKNIPNWKKLSIFMRARYGSWIVKSNSVWETKFIVKVTYVNGHKINEPYSYPFEYRSDAEECLVWWQNNDCSGVIKEV